MTESGEVRRMYALAARQHGVVTRAQLRRLGLTDDRIDRRLASGALTVLHRGVFLVGPLPQEHTRGMAAVLACGDGTVLSHVSAAVVWRIAVAHDTVVHVMVPGPRRRRRPGIRVHEARLAPDEVTRRNRIPVTSCARTLLDFAATAPTRELERAVAEAVALRLVSERQLRRLVERHGGTRGSARLRALLNSGMPAARTRSEAEESLLALIRRSGLPVPRVNERVHGFEVDFRWSAERLIVEVDGYAFHGSRERFEGDRSRDAELMAAGYRVVRVTWKQLEKEPEAVLVRLTQALMQPR